MNSDQSPDGGAETSGRGRQRGTNGVQFIQRTAAVFTAGQMPPDVLAPLGREFVVEIQLDIASRVDVRRSCATSCRHSRLRKRFPQPMDCRMELSFDGSFRQIQRVSDLAEFHALIMTHHEDDSLSFGQAADFELEHLAEFTSVRAFFRSRGFLRGVQHSVFRFVTERCRARARSKAAPIIDTCIHDDSIHPRGQLGVMPEPVERPVDFDEHLLRDVLGVVMVSRKLIRDPIHHRAVTLDQRLEGGRVAAGSAGDQVRIGRHHA